MTRLLRYLLLLVLFAGAADLAPTSSAFDRLGASEASAAEPTLVASAVTADFTPGVAARTAGAFTWLTGDVFYVCGLTEDNGVTLTTPTGGPTLSLVTDTNTASNTRAYLWEGTAASGSTGTFSADTGAGSAGGLVAFQFRASDGRGTPQTIIGQNARLISVTRGQANSHVLACMADWVPNTDVTVTPSPTGTQMVAALEPGLAAFFGFRYPDQGATGTTSYGFTDQTGTVDMTGIAWEVEGTAGGGGSSIVPIIMQQLAANDDEYDQRLVANAR